MISRSSFLATRVVFSARMLSDFVSYSQTLKIQAVIFDITVAIGDIPDVSTKPLTSDDCGALRGIKPSIKANNVYDTSNEITNVATIQTKYMEKLRKRTGGSFVDKTTSMRESDAQMLNRAKSIPVPIESSKPSRWLLVEKMGDLLDYISNRTMSVGLLCHLKTPKEYRISLLEQLLPMKAIAIDVSDKSEVSNLIQFYSEQLVLIEQQMQLPSTRSIMIVSSNDAALESGKVRGYYTCRFRPPNGLYGSISTDFVARDILEIQDAMESVNGVALRPSAFSSRAYKH